MTAPSERLTQALADRYRIERELGQGGMATVYLAEDLKHQRRVAIKVLKPDLAAVLGAERFVQEITTTASLQHPHILPLFDSGTAGGFLFYVMPYIEGETLRTKLDRETQFGIDEAIRITTEVADALDYAHRHGVIHRDIKPENILLHDGRPMVADFGIALAVSAAAGGRMTETGLSLGTPHYMSPEQATAEKDLSARSDIYSLGSVLYEMLTGSPPHVGATAQQIIMKIVTEEAAPVTAVRKSVPEHVAAAVATAIERLPADRFESASAFAEALRDPGYARGAAGAAGLAGGGAASGSAGVWKRATLAASAAALVLALVAVWALQRPTPSPAVGRFALALGDSAPMRFTGRASEPPRVAISPDGRQILYTGLLARPAGRSYGLFLRPMDQLEGRFLPGTDSATAPAVSPDGSMVAFITGERPEDRAIKIASLQGGPPVTIARGAMGNVLSWGPAGHVYFLDAQGRMIRRVWSGGGAVEDVLQLKVVDSTARYGYLHILPEGRAALVGSFPANRQDASRYVLRAVDLDTGAFGAEIQGVAGVYSASGHLVFVTYDQTLMGVGFDPKHLTLKGRPAALVQGVDVRPSGETDLALSREGTLVYATLGLNAAEEVVWVDRGGSVSRVDPEWTDQEYEDFELSPDGTRAAVTIAGGRSDIWVKQLDRGPRSRLTFDGDGNFHPAWSADGRYISFVSVRDGKSGLWRRRADGVGEVERVIPDLGGDILETRWSRDGKWLLLVVIGSSSQDILVMELGTDSLPRPLLAGSYDEGLPALSPDSRWLAYVSTETGTPQVFVRPFPAVEEGKWQISTAGGDAPVWSRDGRELVFRSTNQSDLYSVDMSRGPSAVTPRRLLSLPAGEQYESNFLQGHMFEMSPDGRRFLMVRQGAGDKSGDLVVVQNFFEELKGMTASGRNPQ